VLDEGNKHCYDPTTAKTAIYGLPGDKPVVSNWAGGVVDQVGVFRGPPHAGTSPARREFLGALGDKVGSQMEAARLSS